MTDKKRTAAEHAAMGWVKGLGLEGRAATSKYKKAIDLATGDIIMVGHIYVFVLGVRIQVYCEPKHQEPTVSVEVAAAECHYAQNDWSWSSKNIQFDSPFLRFNPEQPIRLIRESPTKISALDLLIEQREKAREADKEKRKTKPGEMNPGDWLHWPPGSDEHKDPPAKPDDDEDPPAKPDADDTPDDG